MPATRTGAWSLVKETEEASELVATHISFVIPISENLDSQHVHFLENGTAEGCDGGTVSNPKANPGHLCVYMGTAPFGFGGTPSLTFVGNPVTGSFGASKDGALVGINGTAGMYNGTWAVTSK